MDHSAIGSPFPTADDDRVEEGNQMGLHLDCLGVQKWRTRYLTAVEENGNEIEWTGLVVERLEYADCQPMERCMEHWKETREESASADHVTDCEDHVISQEKGKLPRSFSVCHVTSSETGKSLMIFQQNHLSCACSCGHSAYH